MDTEEVSDLDEDFHSALALLHSSEENSTERLRRLLESVIEKKQAFSATLSGRISKKCSRNAKIPEKPIATESQRKRIIDTKIVHESRKLFKPESLLENNTKAHELSDMLYVDSNEKTDVPRISIPDDGSADELLCKICNGAKLGPLILLECQDCQEVYHPLCHQPPVVDIDVYDPRIVWRCSNCVESSPLASSTKNKANFQDADNVCMANERVKKTGNTKDRRIGTTGNGWIDFMQSTASSLDIILLEDTPDVIKAATKIPLHTVKKRIGSKFLIARPITKR